MNSAFAANGLVLLTAGLERLAAVASTLVTNALASYFTWTRLGLDTSFLGRRPPPVRSAAPQPPRIVQSKSI